MIGAREHGCWARDVIVRSRSYGPPITRGTIVDVRTWRGVRRWRVRMTGRSPRSDRTYVVCEPLSGGRCRTVWLSEVIGVPS